MALIGVVSAALTGVGAVLLIGLFPGGAPAPDGRVARRRGRLALLPVPLLIGLSAPSTS